MSKINELIEEARQRVLDLVERPNIDNDRKFIVKDISNIAFDLTKEAYHALEVLINLQVGNINNCREKFNERFDNAIEKKKIVTADNITEHIAIIAKKQIGYFYIMMFFVAASTGYNYFNSNTTINKLTSIMNTTKKEKLKLENIEIERNYWKNKYEELSNEH